MSLQCYVIIVILKKLPSISVHRENCWTTTLPPGRSSATRAWCCKRCRETGQAFTRASVVIKKAMEKAIRWCWTWNVSAKKKITTMKIKGRNFILRITYTFAEIFVLFKYFFSLRLEKKILKIQTLIRKSLRLLL